MVRQPQARQPGDAAARERETSLQPTYEDSIEPDPLYDWELEREGDDEGRQGR